MLSKRDFYSFLIMLLVELVYVSYKITARVAANVIPIIIFRDFAADGFLYIGREFSIVQKRAEIYFYIILLAIISTVLWPFVKLIIYNQIYIIYVVGVLAFLIY